MQKATDTEHGIGLKTKVHLSNCLLIFFSKVNKQGHTYVSCHGTPANWARSQTQALVGSFAMLAGRLMLERLSAPHMRSVPTCPSCTCAQP